MKICFATNNQKKLDEIRDILGDEYDILSLQDIGCHEELAETQKTLEGNSAQKAEYVHQTYGVDCFADDTGLEVYALDGEPGVYSARYAGPGRDNEANIRKLLERLADKKDRRAQFRTVISLIIDGKLRQFEGCIKGEIIDEKKGTAGFGYDPVFVPSGESLTFAQMGSSKKNDISHRALAVAKLIKFLKKKK
ncbi:non-canonical purine NTP diphosphatase [Roseivirga sp. BDSF3-8]|uniref:non-canonical purine NTP diphosphatase n=1 Tax=Roseivirga sp. BDSF3-8 TaxID=3241598 RepID=UPI003531B872